MKKYPGYNGILHDSKTEAKASFKLADLGFLASSKKFSNLFVDPNGETFGAYDDFYHARYGVHLEWKDCKLNGVGSKATSESQLAGRRLRRGGFTIMKDDLDFGWNHSKVKQSIVQTTLTPDRFIVCFRVAPTWPEALAYIKAGIVFCTLASLPSFLGCIRLRQRGLQVGFSMNYDLTDNDGNTVLGGFTYGLPELPKPAKPVKTRKKALLPA